MRSSSCSARGFSVSSSTKAEDALGSVAAVVVNYNDVNTTLRCLQSIRDSSPASRLVVVDNGSQVDEWELVHSQFPEATFLRLDKNIGYAGACNAGVAAALEAGACYVLMMNNDTTIEPGTLPALVHNAREHPNAIHAPKIMYAGETDKVWSAGGRIMGPLLRNEHVGQGDRSELHDTPEIVPWATGCALFVREDTYRRIGPMDEHYFLYLEDVDWCLHAKSIGVQTWFVPDAVIRHEVSRTLKRSEWADDVRYYAYRNGYRLAMRHGSIWTRPLVVVDALWTLAKAGIRSATSASHRHDGHYHVRTRAVLDFLRGHWGPYRIVPAPAPLKSTQVAE